jgi:hypothetical protein
MPPPTHPAHHHERRIREVLDRQAGPCHASCRGGLLAGGPALADSATRPSRPIPLLPPARTCARAGGAPRLGARCAGRDLLLSRAHHTPKPGVGCLGPRPCARGAQPHASLRADPRQPGMFMEGMRRGGHPGLAAAGSTLPSRSQPRQGLRQECGSCQEAPARRSKGRAPRGMWVLCHQLRWTLGCCWTRCRPSGGRLCRPGWQETRPS